MALTSARIATRAWGFLFSAVFSHLLKAALTITILWLAARFLQPAKLFATLFTIRPAALALAFILLIPNVGLQYVKWLLLLRQLDSRVEPAATWYSLLAGFPLGLITPGRWGEIGRAIFLPAYPRLAIATLTAMDKIMNFVVIIMLGGVGGTILLHAGFLPQLPVRLSFSAMVLLVAVASLLRLPALIRRWVLRKCRHSESVSWLHVMQRLDTKFLCKLFVLSFLFVVTFSVQLVILVSGLHPIPAIHGLASAFTIFFVQSVLPLSIGDLGIRESAAAFFFSKLGVVPHAAFAAALVLFMINMLLPSTFGLFLLWKNKPPQQS